MHNLVVPTALFLDNKCAATAMLCAGFQCEATTMLVQVLSVQLQKQVDEQHSAPHPLHPPQLLGQRPVLHVQQELHEICQLSGAHEICSRPG